MSSPKVAARSRKTEYWGLKGLAYKIKKSRKAHYSLMNIDAPPAAVAEMERRWASHTDVIRFITVKVEAHETEPSAMMRKTDRDERGDRGERGGFRGGDRGGFRGGDRGGREGGGGGFRGPREGGGFRGGDRPRARAAIDVPSRPPGGGGGYRGDREGGAGGDRGPRPPRPPRDGNPAFRHRRS